MTQTQTAPNTSPECPWCSSEYYKVHHDGKCAKVKAIEYYPGGAVKRVEFYNTRDLAPSVCIPSVWVPDEITDFEAQVTTSTAGRDDDWAVVGGPLVLW